TRKTTVLGPALVPQFGLNLVGMLNVAVEPANFCLSIIGLTTSPRCAVKQALGFTQAVVLSGQRRDHAIELGLYPSQFARGMGVLLICAFDRSLPGGQFVLQRTNDLLSGLPLIPEVPLPLSSGEVDSPW